MSESKCSQCYYNGLPSMAKVHDHHHCYFCLPDDFSKFSPANGKGTWIAENHNCKKCSGWNNGDGSEQCRFCLVHINFKNISGETLEFPSYAALLAERDALAKQLKAADEAIDEAIRLRGCAKDCRCQVNQYRRTYPAK